MRTLFFFISLTFFFFSCEQRTYKGGIAVTGKVGEILVVCDNGIWDSEVKHYLDTHLTQFIMPYFPDVVTFELLHRTNNRFEGAIRQHRNILFLSIDAKKAPEKGIIEKRKSVWADGQLVIDVVAPNYNELVQTCKNGLRSAHLEFDDAEWRRIMRYFKSERNSFQEKKLAKNFGISLALPDGSSVVSDRTNFCRITLPTASRPIEFVGTGTQDIGSVLSGIMVYQYDYINEEQLSFKNLLMARDTMLKYNVPHEISGLYMGTQYNEFVYPEHSTTTNFNGSIKGIEIRGMFVFTGKAVHSTGGAFWSFHFVHPKRKKVMCISGYVDAPSTTSWTHPLREIQAVWKSVALIP
jgi:hypothetical protein